MNCTICGKPVTLSPSAKERAAKDTAGRSEAFYRNLFKQHAQCVIDKRNDEVRELMRSKQ